MEKLYRKLTLIGAMSLTVGIVSAAVGITAGTLGIVGGALLLRSRRDLER